MPVCPLIFTTPPRSTKSANVLSCPAGLPDVRLLGRHRIGEGHAALAHTVFRKDSYRVDNQETHVLGMRGFCLKVTDLA